LDLKEIKELIALMKKNDLSTFKMEKEGFKITLKKGADYQPVITSVAPPVYTQPHPVAPIGGQPTTTSGGEATPPAKDSSLRAIKSPMPGTFYGAPGPDAPPFVTVGQEVTEDTVVCIIEAMKVMNEIKAETRGVIAEIVAENGKPVQYDDPLFRIK